MAGMSESEANVKFNLQQFLHDMRSEQTQALRDMSSKVDTALAKINDHETRIVTVENTSKTARWMGATIVVALIASFVDRVFSLLPKLLGVKP